MPKVSVIVPVYNTEKYLRRCLDALTGQTLADLELLLIDDGSTDGSPGILAEYAARDRRIRRFHKENGGQASARNLGLREAAGEYIGFADSDDAVERTMFEEMYNLAVETDSDMVECKFFFVEERNGRQIFLKPRGNIRPYPNAHEMLLDPQVSPWNKLYRRRILQHPGLTFPEGLIYEDTAFFMKTVPYVTRSACLDRELVWYYLRSGSTMNSRQEQRVGNIFPVLEDGISFYRAQGFWDEYGAELEYFCSKLLLLSSMSRIGRISSRTLRTQLLNQTFSFLREHFPKYRKNPFLHGAKGLYIKRMVRPLAGPAAWIFGKIVKG